MPNLKSPLLSQYGVGTCREETKLTVAVFLNALSWSRKSRIFSGSCH